ncbi:hypothetical protein B0H13DRAFT_2011199 [Mycena leptocephala]|nr:hypothetical protein B0H13DRAFT_2011199 [Mycena leptocephala]
MHPILRITNLDRLPLSSRKLAKAICRGAPTSDSTERFIRLMETMRGENKLAHLLPVYYSLLDPTRIPTAAELDVLSSDSICAIEMSLLSLQAIFDIETPPQAGRICGRFLMLFHEFLSGLDLDMRNELDLCEDFMTFSREMVSHEGNETMISSAIGFATMAVHTWSCLLDTGNLLRLETGLDDSLAIIFLATNFAADEVIAGAGGSRDYLAGLIMKHLGLVVPDADTDLSEGEFRLIQYALEVWARMDGIGRNITLKLKDSPKPLSCADFLRCGQSTPEATSYMYRCLTFFGAICFAQGAHRVIRDAAQNGILPVLVSSAQRVLPSGVPRDLCILLHDMLAPATVYYHVLRGLVAAYSALSSHITRDSFPASEIYPAWTSLERAILHRLEILRNFESEDYLSRRACDNVECGIIRAKKTLKRCTGCCQLFYCSRECQRQDWRRGHHQYCALYLCADIRLTLTAREIAFLRAVLHSDFQEMRTSIYKKSVIKWIEDPSADLVTFCDYRSSYTTASVRAITITESTPGALPGSHWPDMMTRAFSSGGRMSLHVMMIPDGCGVRTVTIPLRMTSSEVHHSLKAIAAGLKSVDSVLIHEYVKVVKPDATSEIH